MNPEIEVPGDPAMVRFVAVQALVDQGFSVRFRAVFPDRAAGEAVAQAEGYLVLVVEGRDPAVEHRDSGQARRVGVEGL